jgi:hypothetical protein
MSEQDRINEIVAKLPPIFQPYANHYVALLLTLQADEITDIVSNIVNGNTDETYKLLISKLSDAELLTEMDRINNYLDRLNADARAEGEYLKNFLNVIIAIGIASI